MQLHGEPRAFPHARIDLGLGDDCVEAPLEREPQEQQSKGGGEDPDDHQEPAGRPPRRMREDAQFIRLAHDDSVSARWREERARSPVVRFENAYPGHLDAAAHADVIRCAGNRAGIDRKKPLAVRYGHLRNMPVSRLKTHDFTLDAHRHAVVVRYQAAILVWLPEQLAEVHIHWLLLRGRRVFRWTPCRTGEGEAEQIGLGESDHFYGCSGGGERLVGDSREDQLSARSFKHDVVGSPGGQDRSASAAFAKRLYLHRADVLRFVDRGDVESVFIGCLQDFDGAGILNKQGIAHVATPAERHWITDAINFDLCTDHAVADLELLCGGMKWGIKKPSVAIEDEVGEVTVHFVVEGVADRSANLYKLAVEFSAAEVVDGNQFGCWRRIIPYDLY